MEKLLFTHYIKFLASALRGIGMTLSQMGRRANSISLLTRSEREVLERNRQFKDKHRGKRAFVIVNGPSLGDQDISGLGNDITFVVSGFFRHPVIKLWQPSYYCFIDKNYFNGSETTAKFFADLNSSVKTSTFFMPLYRGYKANTKLNLVDKERTFYIATAGPPGRSLEMSDVVQSFAGVSAFALAQAIYMGCNPIYLLGFDHDYLANRGLDRHFYKGGTLPGAPWNTQTLAERIPYDIEMKAFISLWKNYRSLKKIAEKKGIKVINATKGGYLDVFERCDFELLKF